MAPDTLKQHYGHKIVIAKYGEHNYSLECETCNEVLTDTDVLEEDK